MFQISRAERVGLVSAGSCELSDQGCMGRREQQRVRQLRPECLAKELGPGLAGPGSQSPLHSGFGFYSSSYPVPGARVCEGPGRCGRPPVASRASWQVRQVPAEACLNAYHFAGALGFRVDPGGSLESSHPSVQPPLSSPTTDAPLGDMGSGEGKVERDRSTCLRSWPVVAELNLIHSPDMGQTEAIGQKLGTSSLARPGPCHTLGQAFSLPRSVLFFSHSFVSPLWPCGFFFLLSPYNLCFSLLSLCFSSLCVS